LDENIFDQHGYDRLFFFTLVVARKDIGVAAFFILFYFGIYLGGVCRRFAPVSTFSKAARAR
jgi:hypothetical protein